MSFSSDGSKIGLQCREFSSRIGRVCKIKSVLQFRDGEVAVGKVGCKPINCRLPLLKG